MGGLFLSRSWNTCKRRPFAIVPSCQRKLFIICRFKILRSLSIWWENWFICCI